MLRWPSTWSTPFWESSSTTKTALLFQNLDFEMASMIRPVARSLSATIAEGVGWPGWAPVVWSCITHSMLRFGRSFLRSCCLRSRRKMSARYWSVICVWKLG